MNYVLPVIKFAGDVAHYLTGGPQQQQQQQQQQQAPPPPQQYRYRDERRRPQQCPQQYDEDEYEERVSQPNLEFYRNLIPSEPNGEKIEVMLKEWFGKPDLLLKNSNYMQWLFPNREAGVNPFAYPLNRDEAMSIKSNPVLKKRVRRAFIMLLDVYGMTLNEENEFGIKDEDPNLLEKFISHKPAGMWVTRILKSLKDLGHQNLMLPWLEFLAELIYKQKVLPVKFRKSFTEFWLKTLDEAEQKKLKQKCLVYEEDEG